MKLQRHPSRMVALAAVAASTGLAAGGVHAQVIPRVPLPAQADSSALSAAAPAALPDTYVVPSIAVLGTATSNSNFGTGAAPRSDQTLEFVPRVFLISDHARWQVNADLGADARYYVGGTQADTVSPSGSANLHSILSDQFLYFDASMNAQRVSISPYVGQAGALQGSTYTSTQWRVSPYVDRLLTPSLRLQARSDDTWTQVNNTGGNSGIVGGRYLDQTISLAQSPVDWGYVLAARQTYTTYTDQPYAWLRDTTARVIPEYALTQGLVVGVIGGRERVQDFGAEDNASIYGARVQWRPQPGNGLEATVEHRFFGTGWNLQAHGGTEVARFNLQWLRDIASNLAPVGNSSSGVGNVTQLLDGLLGSQYPNPLQRAQMVQALLGDAGLPPGLAASGNFFTSSSSLQNSLVATGLLLRQRDSFALSVYRNRTEDLYLPGQQVLALLSAQSNDNRQVGAAFNYGHRLTPLDTLNLTFQRENDSGFGFNAGRSAHQTAWIAQWDHRLSPRTIALVGLRRQFLTSSVVGNGNESALFAGFVHRF